MQTEYEAADRLAESPSGRFTRWYRFTALAVFNGLLLFVLLNLLFYAVSRTIRPAGWGDDSFERYGDRVLEAYPGWQSTDVRELLKETYREASMEYEPFTVFRNRPLQRRFVNVSRDGYRVSKNQAPWPPRAENFNVFVFGGSTTFGMGLPDDQTIASCLQEQTPAKPSVRTLAVYNFARTYYFSSQERILFQQLLLSGFVPQVAVFVDGLNDFGFPDGQPRFSDRLRRFMAGQDQHGSGTFDAIPMMKAARWVSDRWTSPARTKTVDMEAQQPDRAVLERVATRWIANKRIIELLANGYGVRVIFVWQPVPTYKYDLRYHLLSKGYTGQQQKTNDHNLIKNLWHQGRLGPTVMGVADGYAIMDNLRAQGKLGPNVLWLADMQQDKRENLYVDAVHYTAAFSKEIAKRIYGAMKQPPGDL